MSVVLRIKTKELWSVNNLFFMLYPAARATSVMTPNQLAGGQHSIPFPATNNNLLQGH